MWKPLPRFSNMSVKLSKRSYRNNCLASRRVEALHEQTTKKKKNPSSFMLRIKINWQKKGNWMRWLGHGWQGWDSRWAGSGGSYVWHCSSAGQAKKCHSRDKRTQAVCRLKAASNCYRLKILEECVSIHCLFKRCARLVLLKAIWW